jgi:hypothetical protein
MDITVLPGAPITLELAIQVIGRQSWLRVFADGERVHQGTVRQGETLEFTALEQFCVRAGNAGALTVNFNEEPFGILGGGGEVGTWLFTPGATEPQAAPGAC